VKRTKVKKILCQGTLQIV